MNKQHEQDLKNLLDRYGPARILTHMASLAELAADEAPEAKADKLVEVATVLYDASTRVQAIMNQKVKPEGDQ